MSLSRERGSVQRIEILLTILVGVAVGWFVSESSPGTRIPDFGPIEISTNGSNHQPLTNAAADEEPTGEALPLKVGPSQSPEGPGPREQRKRPARQVSQQGGGSGESDGDAEIATAGGPISDETTTSGGTGSSGSGAAGSSGSGGSSGGSTTGSSGSTITGGGAGDGGGSGGGGSGGSAGSGYGGGGGGGG
jgi:hypothetical protein